MFTDETLPATDYLFPYQSQGHVNIDLYVYDRKQLQYAGFATLGHAASHSTPLQDITESIDHKPLTIAQCVNGNLH